MNLKDWNQLQCDVFEKCNIKFDANDMNDFVKVATIIAPYKYLAKSTELEEYLKNRIEREYQDGKI